MKREMMGWVVAGIVAVLTCTLGAMQQQQAPVGRYQLVESRFRIITKNDSVDSTTLWRIDTVTGDAMMFQANATDGPSRGIGWVPVKDVRPR